MNHSEEWQNKSSTRFRILCSRLIYTEICLFVYSFQVCFIFILFPYEIMIAYNLLFSRVGFPLYVVIHIKHQWFFKYVSYHIKNVQRCTALILMSLWNHVRFGYRNGEKVSWGACPQIPLPKSWLCPFRAGPLNHTDWMFHYKIPLYKKISTQCS